MKKKPNDYDKCFPSSWRIYFKKDLGRNIFPTFFRILEKNIKNFIISL